MTDPTPVPGSSESGISLVQGVNSDWNPILQYVPEDKRGDVIPHLTEWEKKYTEVQEKYKPWEELSTNYKVDDVGVALQTFDVLQNQPQVIYEALGNYLGITPKEAKEMVEEEKPPTGEGSTSPIDISAHPEFAKMKQTVDTLGQVILTERQQQQQAEATAREEAKLEATFKALKEKHGDFDENEVLMRMIHKEMEAEEALQDYQKLVGTIQQRRPAPFVLGSGGQIPRDKLDVRQLSGKETRSVVEQMLSQADTT